MCPPNYCLPLHYSKGTTFSSHFDSRYRWGETVMGINLGAPSVIQFIPQFKNGVTGVTQNIYLPRPSIYIMSGPSRVGWKHGICKVSKVNTCSFVSLQIPSLIPMFNSYSLSLSCMMIMIVFCIQEIQNEIAKRGLDEMAAQFERRLNDQMRWWPEQHDGSDERKDYTKGITLIIT